MSTELKQQHAHSREDEIDLFQLLEVIWQQKALITLITLVCLIGGIAYAFLSTPVYKASTHLKPIYSTTLKPLSSLPLYSELSTGSPLRELLKTLENKSFQQQFINTTDSVLKEKLYPGTTTEKQTKVFSKRFKLVATDEKKALQPYRVEFTAHSANTAANELNKLLSSATYYLIEDLKIRYKTGVLNETKRISQRTVLLETKLATERTDEIIRLQESHDLEQKQLKDQLAARQQAYLTSLNDRIILLKEALSIAAALNISDPITLNKLAKNVSGRIEVTADFSNQKDPLYLRGTRLLGKELEQLKSRSDDYFPDQSVRKLETKIALMQHNRRIETLTSRVSDHPFSKELQALKARAHEVQSKAFPEAFQLDFTSSKAIADPAPIKPKKALIIMLSVVLGGMVGLMAGLIRAAFLKGKKKIEQP